MHVIPTGSLRLRAHWAGLVPGLREGMDEQGNSEEHIELVLWPAPTAPSAVVREWTAWPW
jgi:hypothetical protein